MQSNNIITVELSHENTPIHISEKIRLNISGVDTVLQQLGTTLEEVFVLSTCNRFTIYAWATSPAAILDCFLPFKEVHPYLTLHSETEASARHLFETAGGLRSQVLGEHQILGQIRKTHALTLRMGSIGPVLDQLVREAIRIGKRIRTETHIGKYAASVVTAGFELVKREHQDLSEKSFLVIGTGKIAGLTLDLLQKASAKKVYVTSHHLERACEVAAAWNACALELNQVHEILGEVDVVVGGTHEEIDLSLWEDVPVNCTRAHFAANPHKKMLLIDFGMPRNFNPALRGHKLIKLYDLDDIKAFSQQAIHQRALALPEAQHIIDQELRRFVELYRQQTLSPLLGAYWKRLERLKEENLNWLLPKLGAMDNSQRELIKRFSHKLIRSISREPLQNLRGRAKAAPLSEIELEVLKNLYNLKGDADQNSSVEIE